MKIRWKNLPRDQGQGIRKNGLVVLERVISLTSPERRKENFCSLELGWMQETGVRSLGQEDPLEKELAPYSSTLA